MNSIATLLHRRRRNTSDTNLAQDIREPGWLRRAGAGISARIGYARFERQCLARPVSAAALSPEAEEALNERMREYPRNHRYRIVNGRLVPSFRLYQRLRMVVNAYPQPLRSFLDIGCCRGFYVLDAAGRLGCPRAVGIDVYEPFVTTAQDAARHLAIAGAAFHYASLEQVSADPPAFGGPFQVVLLIGTYHYLFWGSDRCPTAYHSHEEIFRRLASICADRLIISGRIRIDRLPRATRRQCRERGSDVPYTAAAFLQDAGKFFRVHSGGHLGVDPLLVMSKKTNPSSP